MRQEWSSSFAAYQDPGETLPAALDEQVNRAVTVLQSGGVVAYPTDTLYGLGGHAFMERAVEAVYSIKGRDFNVPMPLLLADVSDVLRVAVDVPPMAWLLARRFWPGGLTLVLPRSPVVPAVVSAGMDTVAVRVPYHPVPREIVRRLGVPITGTSANRSGQAAATNAEEAQRALGEDVDLVIDGGPTYGSLGSTILDLTGEIPKILRVGAISADTLEQVCGPVESGTSG